MEIFTTIIGIIALVVFFVMAIALSNISTAVRNTNRIISAWSKETGIGMIFRCGNCKKNYEGRKAVCPHCGDPKTYI
jgi:rRNA maturation endonuclease Nob1